MELHVVLILHRLFYEDVLVVVVVEVLLLLWRWHSCANVIVSPWPPVLTIKDLHHLPIYIKVGCLACLQYSLRFLYRIELNECKIAQLSCLLISHQADVLDRCILSKGVKQLRF